MKNFICILICVFGLAGISSGAILGLNFTAVTDEDLDVGLFPPDIGASVSQDHIVIQTNGSHQLFNKQGVQLQGSSLVNFWAGATSLDRAFDPRVLYDLSSGRWYTVAVDGLRVPSASGVLIGTTLNPATGWTLMRWDADPTDTRFADFPMLGLSDNKVVVSINMFPVDRENQTITYELTKINISDLVNGNVNNRTMNYLPAHTNQVSYGGNHVFRVNVDNVNKIDWTNTDTFTGGTINFGTNYQFAQRGTQPSARGLESDYALISSRLSLVNGSYWGVRTVLTTENFFETKNVAHWFQLDQVTLNVIRQGTVSLPNFQNVLYPSIAVNENGEVVIGFSGTGYANFVSAWAVAGVIDGNTIDWDEPILLKEGVASYEATTVGRNRWGDYSSTVVDPSGGFWTFQLYAASSDQWAVQASQIFVPEPASLILFSSGLLFLMGKSFRRGNRNRRQIGEKE